MKYALLRARILGPVLCLLVAKGAFAQPAEEAPAEEAPVEAAPAEATPAEEVPAEPAPAEAAPASEPAPVAGASADAAAGASLGGTGPEAAASPGSAPTAEPVTSAPPPAPPIEPASTPMPMLKVGGDFWSRLEVRDGYDRLGRSRTRFIEGDATFYRTRLSLSTVPMDIGGGHKVSVAFAPQADGFFGNQPSTISTPNLGVYEAFLSIQNDLLKFDIGHFSMNYGDAMVIGNLVWHQTARSFDGMRARFAPKGSKYWVDLFATQLAEGRGGPDTDAIAGDQYFVGAYSEFGKLLSDKTELQPYLLGQFWGPVEGSPVDPADPAAGTVDVAAAGFAHIGLRAKQDFGFLDLRFEGGYQIGSEPGGAEATDRSAFHVNGEVGVKPAKGLRLALEGSYASGDDPDTDTNEAYSELYPTTHKFLGLMDIIGFRTNVASGVLHVAYKGLKPVVLKADVHTFLRPQTGTITVDGADIDQESYAGAEADINAIYVIGKNTKLRGMYALFLPGSDHFMGGADDIAHYVEVQLGTGF